MRAGHHARFLLFRSVVLFLLLAAGGVVPVAADVVVLKSGRRIQAVNVEERDGKVYYEIELGRIGIPRRLVERIERGDYVAQPPKVAEVPAAADLAALSDADVLRVVTNGTVDRGLLLRLEHEASANAASGESRHRPGERAVASRRGFTSPRGSDGRSTRSLILIRRDPCGVSCASVEDPCTTAIRIIPANRRFFMKYSPWIRLVPEYTAIPLAEPLTQRRPASPGCPMIGRLLDF